MAKSKHPPSKNRRDIGQVVFPIEKLLAAREFSSCCVGTEARLETNSGFEGLSKQVAEQKQISKKKGG